MPPPNRAPWTRNLRNSSHRSLAALPLQPRLLLVTLLQRQRSSKTLSLQILSVSTTSRYRDKYAQRSTAPNMSTQHRFPADRQLTTRMLITVFLIGLLYAVFVAALFAARISLGFIIIFAGGMLIAQLYFSDRIALYSMGGKLVTEQQAPQLYGVVSRLC